MKLLSLSEYIFSSEDIQKSLGTSNRSTGNVSSNMTESDITYNSFQISELVSRINIERFESADHKSKTDLSNRFALIDDHILSSQTTLSEEFCDILNEIVIEKISARTLEDFFKFIGDYIKKCIVTETFISGDDYLISLFLNRYPEFFGRKINSGTKGSISVQIDRTSLSFDLHKFKNNLINQIKLR